MIDGRFGLVQQRRGRLVAIERRGTVAAAALSSDYLSTPRRYLGAFAKWDGDRGDWDWRDELLGPAALAGRSRWCEPRVAGNKARGRQISSPVLLLRGPSSPAAGNTSVMACPSSRRRPTGALAPAGRVPVTSPTTGAARVQVGGGKGWSPGVSGDVDRLRWHGRRDRTASGAWTPAKEIEAVGRLSPEGCDDGAGDGSCYRGDVKA